MTRSNRALWGVAVVALAGTMFLAPALASTPLRQAEEAAGGGAPSAEAKEYYRQGVELMNSSRFLDAVERFQLALDEAPDYVDAHRRLAFVYTQMGATEADYYQDALDVYEEIQAMLPEEDVDIYKSIAFVQYAMGDVDDAIETYEQILEITPDDCEVWEQIGNAEKIEVDRLARDEMKETPEYKERLEKAVSAYTKVTELCPENTQASQTLAEIYFHSGQREEAASLYGKMLEVDPDNLETLTKLAYLHKQSADAATKANSKDAKALWKKAIPVYEKILELDASRTNDRMQYAVALQKGGRLIDAAAQFETIIEADPESNSRLYCNLANLYALDAKDAEKTIEICMKGIAANAPVAGCLNYFWGKGLELRGTNMLNEGRYDRSITTYRESKLKFSSILNDPNFGNHAKKQMDRLDQLILRAEQTREKAKQGR